MNAALPAAAVLRKFLRVNELAGVVEKVSLLIGMFSAFWERRCEPRFEPLNHNIASETMFAGFALRLQGSVSVDTSDTRIIRFVGDVHRHTHKVYAKGVGMRGNDLRNCENSEPDILQESVIWKSMK